MKISRKSRLPARGALRLVARTVAAFCILAGLVLTVPAQPVSAATFTVTKTADTNDGACNADCSLREAIVAANAAAGADIITVPAGTYTLTRSGVDNTANNGDLDVTGPLMINGAGQALTIIEAGSSSSTAIDRVFSFNPLGTSTGFDVSLNHLTIRNGKNPNSFATQESDGGCFDFDGGTSGLGSLAMTFVTVSNCETSDGDAGGVALFLINGGSATISGSTIQNNIASRSGANSGNGGGLAVFCVNNLKTANLTISGGSVIQGNSTRSGGGANNGRGGGIFAFGACSGTATFNYQIHRVFIINNSSGSDGGGIYSTAPLTINNSSGETNISRNTAGRDGGGVWLNHSNGTSNISKASFFENSAVGSGGAVYLGPATTGNVLNLSFSRMIVNTAASGSGLFAAGGTANATNNWWGCSTGPGGAPCDTAQGSGGSITFDPWLRVLTTASPATILNNQSTSLTASANTNSNGQDVSADIDVLKGLDVTWSAVGGTISNLQYEIQPGGTATATYTATAANAGNQAAAKVGNDSTTSGSNVAIITVNPASGVTTTTITSDNPDPSVVGQAVTVQYSVTAASETPTGNVTVSDGTQSCTGTVAAGQCSITFTSAGAKTLTATYSGDGNFNGSTSATAAHTVNKAITSMAITADSPDPSAPGQAVIVQYAVSVSAPGSGTPTGNVTVTDGTDSCIGTVAAGQCAITLTTSGARFLVANYSGDSNFHASFSANNPHTVDGTAPTVSIDQSAGQADPTGTSPILFTVTFSEPVSGFDDTDVTLSGTAGATSVIVSGGPVVFDAAVSGMSADGSVTANIAAGAAQDEVGNLSQASTSTDNTVTFFTDSTPPDTTIDSFPANPSASTSASFTFSGTDNQTPAGSLTFECELDGGSFSVCTSPQNYSSLALGSHTFQVRAIDLAGNIDLTPASYTWQIYAPTSLLYNGGQIVNVGSGFKPGALLGSPASACKASQPVSFSLDRSPTTGAAGSYSLGTATTNLSGQASLASVSTTGWIEGIYTITASFAGTASCDPSSDSATLTVAAPGNSATGGGWYTLSGSGRINFGFTVRKTDSKCTANCAYKGHLLLINNGKWRLVGALNSYSKLSNGNGAAGGAGDLYWWDTSLNGGLGDWALAKSGVNFTTNFYDSGKSGKSSTDSFTIRIVYTPVSPQPSTLPNSNTLQLLKGGDIKVN